MTQEREQVQKEIAENREERKQRLAAAQRLQFQRSVFMLRAAHLRGASSPDQASLEEQSKNEKTVEDFALFIYRLESDFEDKRRRLEKMLFSAPVRSNSLAD